MRFVCLDIVFVLVNNNRKLSMLVFNVRKHLKNLTSYLKRSLPIIISAPIIINLNMRHIFYVFILLELFMVSALSELAKAGEKN